MRGLANGRREPAAGQTPVGRMRADEGAIDLGEPGVFDVALPHPHPARCARPPLPQAGEGTFPRHPPSHPSSRATLREPKDFGLTMPWCLPSQDARPVRASVRPFGLCGRLRNLAHVGPFAVRGLTRNCRCL